MSSVFCGREELLLSLTILTNKIFDMHKNKNITMMKKKKEKEQ